MTNQQGHTLAWRLPTLEEEYNNSQTNNTEAPVYAHHGLWNKRISLWEGDITQIQAHAIVNAAQPSLLGGGGVDGAIHNAAGPLLMQERLSFYAVEGERCPIGEVRTTRGHQLPVRHVIHAVGPNILRDGNMQRGRATAEQERQLIATYNGIMEAFSNLHLHTLVIPCISAGIYGYQEEPATHVALGTVRRWMNTHPREAMMIKRIVFCTPRSCDNPNSTTDLTQLYRRLVEIYFPR